MTFAAAIVACGAGAAAAQTVPTLGLQRVQGVGGMLATAEGVAGSAAKAVQKYSVQDLDLMQPVAVRLEAIDRTKPVALKVVKGEWDKVHRECVTDDRGACEVKFRTQGNFGLIVAARGTDSASYRVAVWAGDEIKTVPANLIVPAGRAERAGGWTRVEILLAGIAGLLIAGIGLVAVLVVRRKGRSS